MSPLFNPKLLIFTILWLTPEKPDCDIFLYLALVEEVFCVQKEATMNRENFLFFIV